MITERDIREKTFAKATFGGYDMSEVDEFLEEMAADAVSTQKEFGTLRGKMKVLVDKIEEYRSTEDAMRLALVSAQKVAQEVEQEANEKAAAILAEAQEKADAILAEANAKAEEIAGDLIARREMEEKRLAAASEASADYIEKMLAACQKHGEFLTALSAVSAEGALRTAEETAEEAAEEAEEAVEEVVEETAEELTEELVEALPEETAPAVPEPDESWAPAEDVDEPTRMFRF